jgi:hypothetical protein
MDTTTVEVVTARAVEVQDRVEEELEVEEAIADESESDGRELSIEELEEFFRGLN